MLWRAWARGVQRPTVLTLQRNPLGLLRMIMAVNLLASPTSRGTCDRDISESARANSKAFGSHGLRRQHTFG